jgi:hypothetical protein
MDAIRGIVAATIIIALVSGGHVVATLEAATPPTPSADQLPGSPDADDARRVVMDLGVGHYVAIKLHSGKTVRGYIGEIVDDHFVVLSERAGFPTNILYGDVRQLRRIRPPVPPSWTSPSPATVLNAIGLGLMGFYFVTAAILGD